MPKIPINGPLSLSQNIPNVDGRFGPYTSVADANEYLGPAVSPTDEYDDVISAGMLFGVYEDDGSVTICMWTKDHATVNDFKRISHAQVVQFNGIVTGIVSINQHSGATAKTASDIKYLEQNKKFGYLQGSGYIVNWVNRYIWADSSQNPYQDVLYLNIATNALYYYTGTALVALTAGSQGSLVTSVNGQTGAVTITIPTKLSDLTNDVGFITNAGVTSFNGQTGAVTYTPPVTSVNNKTGAVVLSPSDIGLGNVDNTHDANKQVYSAVHDGSGNPIDETYETKTHATAQHSLLQSNLDSLANVAANLTGLEGTNFGGFSLAVDAATAVSNIPTVFTQNGCTVGQPYWFLAGADMSALVAYRYIGSGTPAAISATEYDFTDFSRLSEQVKDFKGTITTLSAIDDLHNVADVGVYHVKVSQFSGLLIVEKYNDGLNTTITQQLIASGTPVNQGGFYTIERGQTLARRAYSSSAWTSWTDPIAELQANVAALGPEIDYIKGVVGKPLVVNIQDTTAYIKIPYTIPSGTKIISLTRDCYGKTNANDGTYQSLYNGVTTDRDIRYIKCPYSGDNEIVIDGYDSQIKSVTVDRINTDLFIETVSSNIDYFGTIAELYILAPIPTNSVICAKYYGGSLYIRQKTTIKGNTVASGAWQSVTSVSSFENDKVYQLKCTTAGTNPVVAVGAVVGYIIFKDITKFKTLQSTAAGGNALYNDWVQDMTKSPIIAAYLNSLQLPIGDGAVTQSKIADSAVSTSKIADYTITDKKVVDKFIKVDGTYDIRGSVKELYIKEDAVVFDDAGGYTIVCLKKYGDTIYILSAKTNSNSRGWTASLNPLSSIQNGKIYPIKVTTAGANALYSVGDTVGYIIFKDKSLLADEGGSPSSVIRDAVIYLSNSPIINAYLQVQNVDVQDAVKYPKLRLPSDIYVVAGDSLMIFYKSIIKAYNHKICGIKVVGSKGKAYPNYYQLQTSDLGNYDVTFSIIDDDYNTISSKTVTIHVISSMSAPSSNKNVLVFGASATANGMLAGELDRRLTKSTGDGTSRNPTGLGLNNITFVGRKVGSDVNVHQEATGGWAWGDYAGTGRKAYRFFVTGVNQLNINDKYTHNGVVFTIVEINVTQGTGNIRCTYEVNNPSVDTSGTLIRSSGSGDATITYTSAQDETYNPFWNPDKTGGAGLDFVNYANLYCNGSIDVMIAHCGVNDLSGYTSATIPNLFTNYVKPFIRAYHNDFPNGKFIISTLPLPSPTGGMAANYGASSTWNWLAIAKRMWAFADEAEKLCKETEFSSYVYLADDLPVFDCEHSYPYEMAYVNNRSSVKEERGINGVHPTEVGTYQVSDAIYATFNRLTW